MRATLVALAGVLLLGVVGTHQGRLVAVSAAGLRGDDGDAPAGGVPADEGDASAGASGPATDADDEAMQAKLEAVNEKRVAYEQAKTKLDAAVGQHHKQVSVAEDNVSDDPHSTQARVSINASLVKNEEAARLLEDAKTAREALTQAKLDANMVIGAKGGLDACKTKALVFDKKISSAKSKAAKASMEAEKLQALAVAAAKELKAMMAHAEKAAAAVREQTSTLGKSKRLERARNATMEAQKANEDARNLKERSLNARDAADDTKEDVKRLVLEKQAAMAVCGKHDAFQKKIQKELDAASKSDDEKDDEAEAQAQAEEDGEEKAEESSGAGEGEKEDAGDSTGDAEDETEEAEEEDAEAKREAEVAKEEKKEEGEDGDGDEEESADSDDSSEKEEAADASGKANGDDDEKEDKAEAAAAADVQEDSSEEDGETPSAGVRARLASQASKISKLEGEVEGLREEFAKFREEHLPPMSGEGNADATGAAEAATGSSDSGENKMQYVISGRGSLGSGILKSGEQETSDAQPAGVASLPSGVASASDKDVGSNDQQEIVATQTVPVTTSQPTRR